MIELSYKLHSELSPNDLTSVAKIKQERWPHSIRNQIDWMNQHIEESDYHLFVKSGNEIQAYLNLVQIEAFSNNDGLKMLGIGNVCTKKLVEGKGLGRILLAFALFVAKRQDKICGLLCKDNLVEFYGKNGFSIFKGKVFISNQQIESNLMTSSNLQKKELNIDRNF